MFEAVSNSLRVRRVSGRGDLGVWAASCRSLDSASPPPAAPRPRSEGTRRPASRAGRGRGPLPFAIPSGPGAGTLRDGGGREAAAAAVGLGPWRSGRWQRGPGEAGRGGRRAEPEPSGAWRGRRRRLSPQSCGLVWWAARGPGAGARSLARPGRERRAARAEGAGEHARLEPGLGARPGRRPLLRLLLLLLRLLLLFQSRRRRRSQHGCAPEPGRWPLLSAARRPGPQAARPRPMAPAAPRPRAR